MIHSADAGVKASARTSPGTSPKIPFPFRADPIALDGLGLDATARAVFVLILDNAKSRGWKSRLSNATIGRILGRCPMTISRALGRLEAAGLIRRELIAGGRIRLAVHVTWEGVRRESLTEQASLRRERLTGSARASEGLGASAEQIRSPIQSERSDGPSLSIGEDEDPASRVASGPEQAAYLRACIAAGRKGQAPPPPPSGGYTAPPTPPHDADRSPRGIRINETAAKGAKKVCSLPAPPNGPVDDARRAIGEMTKALAERFTCGDAVRRRPNYRQLQASIAEMRRRHGARKASGGP